MTASPLHGDDPDLRRTVSESDADSIGSLSKKKLRRRKRGGRYKPYNKLSPEEDPKETSSSHCERFLHGKPMAPKNTTQFLLDDIETREESNCRKRGRFAAVDLNVQRFRSESSVDCHPGDESGTSCSNSDLEKDMEREFEEQVEASRLDRISKMSRQEVESALIDSERENEATRLENARLASLLRSNGIIPDQVREEKETFE